MVKHIKSQICSARTRNAVRDWMAKSPTPDEVLNSEEDEMRSDEEGELRKNGQQLKQHGDVPRSPASQSPFPVLQRHLEKGINSLVSNGLGAWRTGGTVHDVDLYRRRP